MCSGFEKKLFIFFKMCSGFEKNCLSFLKCVSLFVLKCKNQVVKVKDMVYMDFKLDSVKEVVTIAAFRSPRNGGANPSSAAGLKIGFIITQINSVVVTGVEQCILLIKQSANQVNISYEEPLEEGEDSEEGA